MLSENDFRGFGEGDGFGVHGVEGCGLGIMTENAGGEGIFSNYGSGNMMLSGDGHGMYVDVNNPMHGYGVSPEEMHFIIKHHSKRSKKK